jgi:lysophospholipase L1-like esterase
VKIRTAVVLVAGNLAVLVVIVMGLNLLAAAVLDVQYVFRRAFFATDDRVDLPNFTDKERAKTIFDEFRDLRTEYAPFVVWSRMPYAGRATTVNGAGDRVHSKTTDDPVGVVRFFGGSSTWGSGVDDEATLPARFNALYPSYEVHNHGETGFNSRQELARLVNLVNQGAPMDLVIFYDGANDASSFCRSNLEFNGNSRAGKIQRRVHPSSEILNTLIGALVEIANGKFVRKHLSGTQTPIQRCQDASYAEQVARTMVNNWRIAKGVSAVGGARFLAILQPMAAVGRPKIDHLPPEDLVNGGIDLVYAHIRKLVAEDLELDFVIDMSNAYDVNEYIFIDWVHATQNGHDIVARKLHEVVDPFSPGRRTEPVAGN